jgi:O-antigen/teichoic acid export membrane protein
MGANGNAASNPVTRAIQSMTARVKGSTLAKNSLWVFSGQGASIIIQALYFLVIARLLTPSQMGLFAGAAAFVTMVASYSSLGSGLVFLRHVSVDPSRRAVFFGNVLLTIGVLGTVLAIGIHLSARWLVGAESVGLITVVAIGDLFFQNIAGCMSQIFQTFELMRISAFIALSVNASRLVMAFVLLISWHQVSAMTWAYASVSISALGAVISLVAVWRKFGRPRFEPHLAVKHAGEGLSFAMSGTAVGAYNDIDKVMLVHYGMAAQNGLYAMAYRVVDVCTVPIRSIHSAAFPRFFKLGATGVEPAYQFASRLLKKTYIVALLGAAAMLIGAPILPHVIGKNYLGTVAMLRWLCLMPLFRAFHLSAGDAITGVGRQRLRLGLQFAAAFLNFGMNLYLIPHYSIFGAAWASLATDGSLAVICWMTLFYLIRKERRGAGVPQPAVLSQTTP